MSGRRLGRCGCSPSCKTMASTSSLLGANREVEMVAGGLDNIEAIALYMGSDACRAVPRQSGLKITLHSFKPPTPFPPQWPLRKPSRPSFLRHGLRENRQGSGSAGRSRRVPARGRRLGASFPGDHRRRPCGQPRTVGGEGLAYESCASCAHAALPALGESMCALN